MTEKNRLTYKAAGVDIDTGDEFIKRILPFASATRNRYSMDKIGSFAGMLDLSNGKWKTPVLIACTDGVGTKLKLAFEMDRHKTIGIDLVAMSVNDLLVTGAEPVAFLDYLATSKLDLQQHTEVVEGIAEGCRESGCVLVGGETAELPGFYSENEYDLAGFAVGIGDRDELLSPENCVEGDVILGLSSSGIHSNGYSLVRKIFEDRSRFPLDQPLDDMEESLGNVLLKPTRIYRREMDVMMACGGIRSIAHITGGGIPGNLPRALPGCLGASLIKSSWPIPEIFQKMRKIGSIDGPEMYRTFNMGLGLMVIVARKQVSNVMKALADRGYESFVTGEVVTGQGVTWVDSDSKTVDTRVFINNDSEPNSLVSESLKTERRRVAILGSGRGSNMASICNAIDSGCLAVEIGCVISNRSNAFILERARERHIPALHISSKTNPENEGQALMAALKKHKIDAVVLAGYMKKLPELIVQEFKNRIFNIHPALLPAFGGRGMYGMKVHEAVITSGAKYSGVTVHLVDENYDTGKILAQRVVNVLPDDDPESLAAKVLVEEHALYWRVLNENLK